MDLRNTCICVLSIVMNTNKKRAGPPVPMIRLFYTARLVSEDHIFHESEILQNLVNFGPVPSNTWLVDITAYPFLKMLKLRVGNIRLKCKSLFSISCFDHIEIHNVCEIVLGAQV